MLDAQEIEFLRELTSIQGTSGHEDAVRDYLKARYAPIADDIRCDGMGSLMASHGAQGPRILAVGHMDEVGFMVRAITSEGFVKFSRCGFFFITGVMSQHFTIQTDKGPVDALCAVGPGAPMDKYPDMDDLYMDIGCSSREEAEAMGVRVGDFIEPKPCFEQLGPEKKLLLNKAWDNRIGCAVALRTMEALRESGHSNVFIGGGTTQEEVGTRGARSLGYMAEPDIAFSVDIGLADDLPGNRGEGSVLGKGPELCFMDSATISQRRLIRFVVEVAEACHIPYQTAIMKHGGTDASQFQNVRSGAPSMLINVPTRYAHTPTSVLHYDDYVNTVRLLTETVRRLDQAAVDAIRAY